MPKQAVQYQTDLLTELIEDAETNATLSPGETECLRHRIKTATTKQEIDTIWAELDDKFQVLDEDQWTC